jgi:hypothetical protein
MVASRLGGGGTVAEAAVQRLRAALRQKAGECAALEGRLKELEATRDQLASELVKATHSAEEVCCGGGLMWRCGLLAEVDSGETALGTLAA